MKGMSCETMIALVYFYYQQRTIIMPWLVLFDPRSRSFWIWCVQMSPHSYSTTSQNYRCLSQEDVASLMKQNAKSFDDIGLELYCFKVCFISQIYCVHCLNFICLLDWLVQQFSWAWVLVGLPWGYFGFSRDKHSKHVWKSFFTFFGRCHRAIHFRVQRSILWSNRQVYATLLWNVQTG